MSSSNGPPGPFTMKKFSLASKPSSSTPSSRPSSTKPPSALGKRSRPPLHHASDSESDREPEPVAVTAFGATGAETRERHTRSAPIIEKLPNRDWRAEARQRRGGKNLLPPEVQAQREGARKAAEGRGKTEVQGGEEIKWGLTLRSKEDKEKDVVEGVEPPRSAPPEPTEALVERVKTDDDRALDALLGREDKVKRPDLVIASTEDTTYEAPVSDGDAYQRAIAAAPDASTLQDYEDMPVEDFGAALLRGMGWKGEKVATPKEGKRRLNLLGLGARELKGAEELGAWVQKSDVKRLNTGARKERREKPGEYREREDKKRRERDERYGGRDDRDRREYRDRDRERRR
ncbi:hypothetical protein V502_09562 [Pseudogymnoascus sp. VKM F-4520 (FW-2644)]|nr:hypothetical protein V502_09562 [Pseudogymnoascus sp. VKM F-4520 (FW-2644)]